MPKNVFDLACYTPDLFEYKPLNIYGSIDTDLLEESEDDWKNAIFLAEPETHKPWVGYYRQSVITGELVSINDPVFRDHWKEYHSSAEEWDCDCKDDDRTESCYCDDDKSSAKCSPW